MKVFRSLLAATAALLSSQIAQAGDYARDPCPVPDAVPAADRADALAQFRQLTAQARQLDKTSEDFNKECDVQNKVGSSAEVSCANREVSISADLDQHSKNVDAYNSHLNALLQAHFAELQAEADATRAKLRQISVNAESWQQQAEGWLELGQEARSAARLQALVSTVDLVVESEQASMKENIELDENALDRIKALYASGNRFIPDEFRASLTQEVTSLRTKRDLLMILQQLSLTAERAHSLYEPLSQGKKLEGLGMFTVGVLKESLLLMQASPEAKTTVTAFEISLKAGYGWLARVIVEHRVDQLADLQEQQLRAVNALSKLYVSQVQKLKAARAAQSDLTGAACYKVN